MTGRASYRFIAAALTTTLAGLLQSSGILSIAGVKPNLSLAALIALSFFLAQFWHYLVLVLIAVFFLKFEPGFDAAILWFAAVASGCFWLKGRLPGRPWLNNLALAALATIGFYLLADWSFLAGQLTVVFWEIMYNMAAAGLVFLLAQKFSSN